MRETSHTNEKGDNGLFKVMNDLNERGAHISIPVSTHLPYDLIVDYNGKLLRIQVKYAANENGRYEGRKSYTTKDGIVSWHYDVDDFELYAIYLAKINKCVYVPNVKKMTSMSIRTELPKSYATFHWWEDFLNLDAISIPPKKSIKEFVDRPVFSRSYPESRKVQNRPSSEELQKLLEKDSYVSVGKLYGVSDGAVRKWVKSYGIQVVPHKRKGNRFIVQNV